MKWTIFFALFFSFQLTKAQTFRFPKLLTQSGNMENFIPKNWKIIDSASGDLNKDKLVDVALIIEYKDSISESRAYGKYEIELIKEIQQPRILVVLFKNKSGGYKLAVQNNDFILRSEEGGKIGDPLKDLYIKDHKLTIAFEGGSQWRWKLNYAFEYQQKEWNLVTANNIYYNKDSGEMVDKRYDFEERIIKTTIGSIFNRNILNYKEEDIFVFGSPRTLNDFKKPWTWEVTADNYL